MTNFFLAIAAYQLPRYKSLMPPRQSLDYPSGGWENGVEDERKEESHNALHHTPTKSTGPQTTPIWNVRCKGAEEKRTRLPSLNGENTSQKSRASERASGSHAVPALIYYLPIYFHIHTTHTHTHTHTRTLFSSAYIRTASGQRAGGREDWRCPTNDDDDEKGYTNGSSATEEGRQDGTGKYGRGGEGSSKWTGFDDMRRDEMMFGSCLRKKYPGY